MISSKNMPAQAKIILEKISKAKNDHTKEAILADYLDSLLSLVDSTGYEYREMGFQGITQKLSEEGVI